MGVVIIKGEWAVLVVNLGHPIVTNVTLLHSYGELREPIEQLFGVLSGAGPIIRVLEGGPRASRGRGRFWH